MQFNSHVVIINQYQNIPYFWHSQLPEAWPDSWLDQFHVDFLET